MRKESKSLGDYIYKYDLVPSLIDMTSISFNENLVHMLRPNFVSGRGPFYVLAHSELLREESNRERLEEILRYINLEEKPRKV